jgi:recombination associated protein RdgC
MWFRNLQLYRFADDQTFDAETLRAALAQKAFKPCGGLDTHRSGWTPPAGRESLDLVHAAQGKLLVCQKRQDRLLPAGVIREALDEKLEQISERENRPVGRREKRQLRDDVVSQMLPKAFTQSRLRHAYIDPTLGLIVVDASTAKQAEELLSLLRETLGSLKVTPLTVARSPAAVLTGWLEKRPASGFSLADECELREPVDHGAVVRGRRIDLAGGDVEPHVAGGMQVSRIAVEWQDRIACVIGDDLGLRRLRFLDVVLDDITDADSDDELARFDADFVLMVMELGRFIPEVIKAFGGLEDD